MPTKKIKLIFLVSEDWYFWSHRLPIAKAALEIGYDVSVICNVSNHREKIIDEGFSLYPINIKRGGKNVFKDFGVIRKLWKLYSDIKPDVVHHVALKPCLYGTLAGRLAGVPIIINALTGLGHVFVSKDWKSIPLRVIVKQSLRTIFKGNNVNVLFQNPDDQNLFVSKNIISKFKSYLIRGSGIDPTRYFPVNHFEEKVPVVTLHSRLLWTKGIREFVEAAKILHAKNMNVRMIIVGEPDPQNPAAVPVEKLIKWHNDKIIEYWGKRDDIPVILNQSSVSVLPSYGEGLPKSLLESSASGLPLVAFDVSGCREIVRHKINGILVPCKDIEDLAAAIEKLTSNPALRQQMGNAGRKMVEEEFSEIHVINQTLDLYQILLNKQHTY